MGQRAKGPRLWMRPEKRDENGKLIRNAGWLILDGNRQIGTGCSFEERAKAEDELRHYINGRHGGRPLNLTKETAALLSRAKIGNVYFISCDRPLFPIKIGFAIDVRVRLRALQGAMPWPLQLLFSMQGDLDKERELHQKFARLRMEGEWFARGHELLEYIEQVKAVSTPSRRRKSA